MIPLRLQLRNFMCYGDGVPALMLDGIHVACLSGDNGHGKSALLDALTWAVWGKARARGDDELINMGKTEMEVELEFAVSGTRYRVIRKRAMKGRRGATTLDLQVQGEDGYRAIGGDSINETQRKISGILRMEYETFINSALLLQGRADEFTLKAPAERKKVLADVLGLAIYDELEDRARQRVRAAEQRRRELAVAMDDIERQLQHQPEYQARRDVLVAELAKLSDAQAAQSAAVRVAREAKQALDVKRHRLDELRQRRQREGEHVRALEGQLVADRAELAAGEEVLAHREEIERGYSRLLVLREQQEALTRQATQLLGLNHRRSELEQAVVKARGSVESELNVALNNLAALRKKVAERAGWQADLEATQQRAASLETMAEKREELRGAGQAQRFECEALKASNERLKEEMVQLRKKIEMLDMDGATCPLCGSSLGMAGKQQLDDQFRAQGNELGAEHRANTARIKDLEAAVAAGQRELATIEGRLRERDQLRGKIGGLERALAEADRAELETTQHATAEEVLRQRLTQSDFAIEEQRELKGLAMQIAGLAYDPNVLERVRRELGELSPFSEHWAKVQQAATAVGLLSAKVRQAEELVARQRTLVAELDGEIPALAQEVQRASRVLQDLAEAEDRLDQLAKEAAEQRVQLGRAEQLLSHCAYLAEQKVLKTGELARAGEEKGIYDELALAFGKKGIQAMIIDGALPEIEDEANLLLARMTDGRMHVKLETQREAKSADGLIETLDIKISDELGFRQYELYSGGEAFRVNFALRIALSKLLARRAGARLQTLIVDEGFGTQDSAGRERLVEAINLVGEEFDLILVITHIQELKDAFPVRIDVIKTAAGSMFSVNG